MTTHAPPEYLALLQAAQVVSQKYAAMEYERRAGLDRSADALLATIVTTAVHQLRDAIRATGHDLKGWTEA